MEVKLTDKGFEFIEADCQYKDFESKFPCDGKISLIRFLYKKGMTLKTGNLFISGNEIDLKPMLYSTLDYQHTLHGCMDYPISIDFKSGDLFSYKQFNKEGWGNYNNSLEKIQLYFDKKQ